MRDEQEALPGDSAPTPDRQRELRAAYEANIAAGKAPYEGVALHARGELWWVMRERGWSGELDAGGATRADFRGVILPEADLHRVHLVAADLAEADLYRTNFVGATLREVNFSGAHLFRANLAAAGLYGANLGGADLRTARMDVATVLASARLDDRTLLADAVWNGVPVTRLNWADVDRLGDEWAADQANDDEGKPKDNAARLAGFQDAVLAYRHVATLLRDQGLNEQADRFAYRAQRLQRSVLRQQHRWGAAAGSWLLDAVAGYGYKPMRSFIAYILIIGLFAGAYLLNAQFATPHLSWDEALVLSVSSFHGRGFFASGISLGDTLARLAAGEAVIGLLIEITFIATFTQRFFNSR